MKTKIEFEGVMEEVTQAPQSGAVLFPYDMLESFGKKIVKVKITYDGIPYRGLLKSMGGDKVYCLILKDIRQRMGKNPGDIVSVTVQEDTEERRVTVPLDFGALMNNEPKLLEFFNSLSYTNRKE